MWETPSRKNAIKGRYALRAAVEKEIVKEQEIRS